MKKRFYSNRFLLCLLLVSWVSPMAFAQDNGTETTTTNEPRYVVNTRHIRIIAISPDGRLIAIADDKNFALIDATSGEKVSEFALTPNFHFQGIQFGPHGKTLFLADQVRGVEVITFSDNYQKIERKVLEKMWSSMARVSVANNVPLVASINKGQLEVYSYEDGQLQSFVDLKDFLLNASCQGIHLTANGGQALVIATDELLLVDVNEKEVVQTLRFNDMADAKLSGDGTLLIGRHKNEVRTIDIRTGKTANIKVSGNRPMAVSSGEGGGVAVFENSNLFLYQGEPLEETFRTTEKHKFDVTDWKRLVIARNGSRAAAIKIANGKGKVMIIDLPKSDDH